MITALTTLSSPTALPVSTLSPLVPQSPHTKNLKVIIASRPSTIHPTVAAKSLATFNQLSKGRAVVHFIAGGSDAGQAKEGDFLSKSERCGRLEEYIEILERAWESPEPFDWEGK